MTTFLATAKNTRGRLATSVIALWCVGMVFAAGEVKAQQAGLDKIQHVIVIYQENWSFDGLYGKFPGADA
jgi:phospholipase C